MCGWAEKVICECRSAPKCREAAAAAVSDAVLSLLLFDILNGMVSFCLFICLFKSFLVITELSLLKLQPATFLVPWM